MTIHHDDAVPVTRQTRQERTEAVLRDLRALIVTVTVCDLDAIQKIVRRLALRADDILTTRWCASCEEWPAEDGDDKHWCGPCREGYDFEMQRHADIAARDDMLDQARSWGARI